MTNSSINQLQPLSSFANYDSDASTVSRSEFQNYIDQRNLLGTSNFISDDGANDVFNDFKNSQGTLSLGVFSKVSNAFNTTASKANNGITDLASENLNSHYQAGGKTDIVSPAHSSAIETENVNPYYKSGVSSNGKANGKIDTDPSKVNHYFDPDGSDSVTSQEPSQTSVLLGNYGEPLKSEKSQFKIQDLFDGNPFSVSSSIEGFLESQNLNKASGNSPQNSNDISSASPREPTENVKVLTRAKFIDIAASPDGLSRNGTSLTRQEAWSLWDGLTHSTVGTVVGEEFVVEPNMLTEKGAYKLFDEIEAKGGYSATAGQLRYNRI